MRRQRFLFIFVGVGLVAIAVASLASASPSSSSTARAVSANTAYPWAPAGVAPAGTADNNWQYPKGDLANSQFSYLKQITNKNVGALKVAWNQSFDPGDYLGGGQAVPIVVSGPGKNLPIASGTMFMTADSGVVAMDPSEREDPLAVHRPAAEARGPGRRTDAGARLR